MARAPSSRTRRQTLGDKRWVEVFKRQRLPLILSGTAALIALLFSVAWLAQIESLVRLDIDASPFRFSSALSLLSLAVALSLSATGLRKLSFAAIAPAFIIALMVLYAAWRDQPVWLDTWSGSLFAREGHSLASAGSVITALGVLGVGAGMLLLGNPEQQQPRGLLSATLSSAALGVAVMSLVGWMSGVVTGLDWIRVDTVSVQSALILALLATAELGLAWRSAMRSPSGYPQGLAIPVMVGALAASIVVARAVELQEEQSANSYAELQATQVAQVLEARLVRVEDSVSRITQLMAEQQDVTQSEWNNAADDYLSDLPGLLVFNLESHGKLRRAEGDRLDAAASDAAWSVAFGEGEPNVGRTVGALEAASGSARFYIAATARGSSGAVVRTLAVFAVDPFLRASLPSTTWTRFSLLLGDRSGTLFEHVIADESELQLSLPVEREGLGWTLGLTVSSDFLDNRRSALPESALGGGLLVAMLLGLSAHLAAQGRYRALSLVAANRELSDGQERLANLVNSLLDGVLLVDGRGTVEGANPAASEMFRCGQGDLLGMKMESLLSESSVGFSALLTKLKTSNMDDLVGGNRELMARRLDDDEFPVAVAVSPFQTPEGRKYAWIIRDISREREFTQERERLIKQLEQQVKLNEELASRYSALVETGAVGMAMVDAEGRFVECNRAFAKMVGYEADELMQMKLQDLNHPDDRTPAARYMNEMIRGERESYNMVKRYVHKDGSSVWVDATGAAVREADGSLRNVVGIALNITERVRIREALQASEKQLLMVNKELESLVYVASHDLRSPLVNLQGFSKQLTTSVEKLERLLDEDTIPEEKHALVYPLLHERIPEALGFIASSTMKMDRLIKGLLRLSRLGRVVLRPRMVDMDKVIHEVVGAAQFIISERGISLEIDELPSCYADEDQVHQVFSNLLDNAIKYLAPDRAGEITISATRLDGSVEYIVADNGLGIAEDHQNAIFEIFHRLSPKDAAGGEGLGLSVVKRIVERNNGGVRVESKLGEGSRFIVTLPAVPGIASKVNTIEKVQHDIAVG
ncbi:MAG: PAS domain S-box protein [Planctomycetes bacterium]|nr:PAS domain S-box protein [Planctomycetota bacterium]